MVTKLPQRACNVHQSYKAWSRRQLCDRQLPVTRGGTNRKKLLYVRVQTSTEQRLQRRATTTTLTANKLIGLIEAAAACCRCYCDGHSTRLTPNEHRIAKRRGTGRIGLISGGKDKNTCRVPVPLVVYRYLGPVMRDISHSHRKYLANTLKYVLFF